MQQYPMIPSTQEEYETHLREQTQANYERMAQERDRRTLIWNWVCVALAAFGLVIAVMLWDCARAWLHR